MYSIFETWTSPHLPAVLTASVMLLGETITSVFAGIGSSLKLQ